MPPGVRSDTETPASAVVSALQGRTMSPLSASGALADDESFFMGKSTNTGSVGESVPSYKNVPMLRAGFGVVKIGHTSLHNPGGRSSWIGL